MMIRGDPSAEILCDLCSNGGQRPLLGEVFFSCVPCGHTDLEVKALSTPGRGELLVPVLNAKWQRRKNIYDGYMKFFDGLIAIAQITMEAVIGKNDIFDWNEEDTDKLETKLMSLISERDD